MAVLTTDPELAKVENDLLALGRTGLNETYQAGVKIGAAITTGVPTTLTDLETYAAHRFIAMLPPQWQPEAQIAAGLATNTEATLNAEATTFVQKEIGVGLQRVRAAMGIT